MSSEPNPFAEFKTVVADNNDEPFAEFKLNVEDNWGNPFSEYDERLPKSARGIDQLPPTDWNTPARTPEELGARNMAPAVKALADQPAPRPGLGLGKFAAGMDEGLNRVAAGTGTGLGLAEESRSRQQFQEQTKAKRQQLSEQLDMARTAIADDDFRIKRNRPRVLDDVGRTEMDRIFKQATHDLGTLDMIEEVTAKKNAEPFHMAGANSAEEAESFARLKQSEPGPESMGTAGTFVGQAAGMIAPSVIPGAGPAIGATVAGLSSAGHTYEQAKDAYLQAGLDEAEADSLAQEVAGRTGLISGAIFAVPVGRLAAMPKHQFARLFVASGVGGAQMGSDTLQAELQAKATYNPNLTLGQIVKDSGKAFAGGAFISGLMHSPDWIKAAATKTETLGRYTPEQIKDLFAKGNAELRRAADKVAQMRGLTPEQISKLIDRADDPNALTPDEWGLLGEIYRQAEANGLKPGESIQNDVTLKKTDVRGGSPFLRKVFGIEPEYGIEGQPSKQPFFAKRSDEIEGGSQNGKPFVPPKPTDVESSASQPLTPRQIPESSKRAADEGTPEAAASPTYEHGLQRTIDELTAPKPELTEETGKATPEAPAEAAPEGKPTPPEKPLATVGDAIGAKLDELSTLVTQLKAPEEGKAYRPPGGKEWAPDIEQLPRIQNLEMRAQDLLYALGDENPGDSLIALTEGRDITADQYEEGLNKLIARLEEESKKPKFKQPEQPISAKDEGRSKATPEILPASKPGTAAGELPPAATFSPPAPTEVEPRAEPGELRPALRTAEGRVIEGKTGDTHNDIYNAQGKAEGLMLRVEQPEHGFVHQGKFLSREQAARAVGETTPLQSERLKELQSASELGSKLTGNEEEKANVQHTVEPDVRTGGYDTSPVGRALDAGDAGTISRMLARAQITETANPTNPKEIVQEASFDANLGNRRPLDWEGKHDGWSVKITTPSLPGGGGKTSLRAWRYKPAGNETSARTGDATEKTGAEQPARTGGQPEPTPVPAAGKQKRVGRGISAKSKFNRETDEIGQDLLSWIADNMPMMSRTAARQSKGKEWWAKNKSDWDDAPERLAMPHHNKIYGGGSTPNQVAQAAYDEGLIDEPHARALWAEIARASDARKGLGARRVKEAGLLDEAAAEHERWETAIRAGKEEVAVDDLMPGDVLDIEGERVEVIERNEHTGAVTVKDGRTFGVQVLESGRKIYVENIEGAEGAEPQYAAGENQTDTPEFKRWFGESKVLDEKGGPLIVWHGSKAVFSEFTLGDVGFHFGTKQASEEFTRLGQEQTHSKPYYLSIQNPLVVDRDIGAWNKPIEVVYGLENARTPGNADSFIFSDDDIDSLRGAIEDMQPDEPQGYNATAFKLIRQWLKERGYDGIQYPNQFEGLALKSGAKTRYASDYESHNSFIALDRRQVKSATENSGAFDPNRTDTRYSAPGTTTPLTPENWQTKIQEVIHEKQQSITAQTETGGRPVDPGEPRRRGIGGVRPGSVQGQKLAERLFEKHQGAFSQCRHDASFAGTDLGRQLQAVAQAAGTRVVFYTGPDGAANGCTQWGHIFVRSNQPAEKLTKVFEHELAHFNDNNGDPTLTKLAALIDMDSPGAKAFRKAYNKWLWQRTGMVLTDAALQQELVADLVAGRTAFPEAPTLDAFRSPAAALRLATEYHRGASPSLTAGGQRAAQPIYARNAVITPPSTGPPQFAITAHHGTPHKVDKFTTAKIGTGEGAQAYGWGLYFAENPEVSSSYASKLSGDSPATRVMVDGKPLLDEYDRNNVRASDIGFALERSGLDVNRAISSEYDSRIKGDLERLKGRKITTRKVGNEYTVSLDVEPEELLDWDKPIGNQPEEIRRTLKPFMEIYGGSGMTGQQLYHALLEPTTLKARDGGGVYRDNHGDPKAVSARLDKMGIKGIRYLDQGSRGANFNVGKAGDSEFVVWSPNRQEASPRFPTREAAQAWLDNHIHTLQKTYNYVIFDESRIRITHENGREITPTQFAAGDFSFDAPESVQEQNARLKAENERLKREQAKGKMLDRADARLAGADIDTTTDMFGSPEGRATRQDKSGQGSLFAAGETPENEPPKSWRELYDAYVAAHDEFANTLSLKWVRNRPPGMKPAEAHNTIAIAAAKMRIARDELLANRDYIARLLEKLHTLAKEGADQTLLANIAMEIDHANPKFVEKVRNELVQQGILPDRKPLTIDYGHKLDELTDWLRRNPVDSPTRSLLERLNLAENAKERWQGFKDGVEQIGAKLAVARKTFVDQYKAPPTDTPFRALFKNWKFNDEWTGQEIEAWRKAFMRQVKDPIRRAAISVWIDAGGDLSLLRMQRDAVPERFVAIWKAATQLTPSEQELGRQIVNNLSRMKDDALNAGLMENAREEYGMPQVWRKPPELGGPSSFAENAPGGTAGNPGAKLDPRNPFFSFRRETPSYFEGIMAGGIPKSLDAADLIGHYSAAFHKSLNSRAFIAAARNEKAADGLPLVQISGMAQEVPLKSGGRGYVVNSGARPTNAAALDGRPYMSVDHWAMKDWKLVFKDGAGKPILVRGDMLVHPDHYDFLKNELGESALREGVTGKLLRPVFASNAYLKASKLAIAGFHLLTIAEHMASHLESPMTRGFQIDLRDPDQELLVRHGLELGMATNHAAFMEGLASHGGLFKQIPGLGPLMGNFSDWMFRDYIPTIMMKVGLHAFQRNLKRYGKELTRDQIAELTATQMNAAGGLLNYRQMGRNKTIMDIGRLALLAPMFLEARGRVVAQAFKPYHHEQRKLLLVQALALFIMARILNALFNNGDPRWEERNWFRVVVGNRAYGLRTIVGDLFHLINDPNSFASGRLSPITRTAIEAGTGRDLRTGANIDTYFQAKIPRTAEIAIRDLLGWLAPVGVEGVLPGQKAKEVTPASMALTSLGIGSTKETANMQVYDWAKDFNESHDARSQEWQKQHDNEIRGESAYRKLDVLLSEGDTKAARREYDTLIRQGHSAQAIVNRFTSLLSRPFTGTKEREELFIAKLNDRQRAVYANAMEERLQRVQNFVQMLGTTGAVEARAASLAR